MGLNLPLTETPIRIGITGASGLIGRSVRATLNAMGHETFVFVRRSAKGQHEISWSPQAETLENGALDNLDAVLHLAGEPVFGRWTTDKKKRILESRAKGTRLLSEAIAQIDRPCPFISASAIGYYGSQSSETVDEASPRGEGFLAEVCEAWESAASAAKSAGQRVVHPRIGLVLSPQGGALKIMLPPFKAGLGGPIGDGQQWMSWIALDDLVQILINSILNADYVGPINCVSPTPIQNQDFTKVLGKVLNRPTFLPVPKFGLKMVFGGMAQETMLASNRVVPKNLQNRGFAFQFSDLEDALRTMLSK